MLNDQISLSNVSYQRDKILALDDVSLSVSSGQWLSVAGRNGSGKSTLLKLMAGLIPQSFGEILFNGKPLRDISDRSKMFSYLSQNSSINADLSVLNLVKLGRYPYLSSWQVRLSADDMDYVDFALDFVGLTELRDRSLYSLSGGEKQRAFLALALAQNGSVLLLDEPTNHLDIVSQIQILNLLSKLVSNGKIVISVFHDLNHIIRYSSHIALLCDGKLLEFGPVDRACCSESLTKGFGVDVQVVTVNGRRCALY